MNGITAARRSQALPRQVGALAAVLVVALGILGLCAPSAFGASSYRVLECFPNAGVRSASDLTAVGYDGTYVQFGVTCNGNNDIGWNKGIVFHPATFTNGPVFAEMRFHAPPTTFFSAGSYRADFGARYPCSGNACYFAAAYAGHGGIPSWSLTMRGTPYSQTFQFQNCGNCNQIWADLSCPSFCMHSASDPSGNANDWYYDYVAIRDIDLNVVDTRAPGLSLGGTVFDGEVTHGTPTLRIDATDQGGGVRTAAVDVNGTRISTPATDCPGIGAGAGWATRFRPCNDLHTTVNLDTTKTPWFDGSNTLRVCAADVNTGPGSGNATCQQRTISVDNSCPDSQGASGQASSITAGLEDPETGKLNRIRAVRSTEGTGLRGRLTSGGGAPVKAASVCVYETVDEPAGIEQLVQVAKSSSTGAFGVQVPGGPSRSLRVAYRYNNRQLESPGMYLDSSVQPTLNLSRRKLSNGRALGFRGRIPGPGNDGRAVTLQARVGKKWRSFKQLQTDSDGRFTGKYRFTQTRGSVLYTFRALVKKQGGYPYSAGASQKRTVVVRG